MDLKLSRLTRIEDVQRGSAWLVLSLVVSAILTAFYPQQLGVLVWNLVKITWAAYLAYWLDRTFFPHARPEQMQRFEYDMRRSDLARFRRAIIIAAAIIGMGSAV